MLVDKPLAELREYQGRNPKPADHEEYWQRGLARQQATDPQVALAPAGFCCPYAECFHMTFTGVGGARVYAKLLRPKQQQAKGPAVLSFHGYSGSSGDWYAYLPYVAAGFTVAAMDCRGQGGLSQDVGGTAGNTLQGHIIRGLDGEPDDLLYRHIFLDTVQLFRVVAAMPQVDETRIGAFGGSQGGGLSLACAGLNPTLARVAPSMPFLCDYQRVWEMDLAKDAYTELTQYFRRFDPMHQRETEIFTRLGYIDVQHLAPRIRARLLMATGLMDSVCPPSTQFAAYNKVPGEKQMRIYPDYCHESFPGFADETFRFFCEM